MDDIKAGRFISLVLRHHPETAGLTLDSEGYADTAELINGVAKRFSGFNADDLDRIVRENNKHRYSYNEDKTKIRAAQGHSLSYVNINFEIKTPPSVLYHGTSETFITSIMNGGLKPMSRQYVHLSADEETAYNVGKRRREPVVLLVDCEKSTATAMSFTSPKTVYGSQRKSPQNISKGCNLRKEW